jgi:hypothetical protein
MFLPIEINKAVARPSMAWKRRVLVDNRTVRSVRTTAADYQGRDENDFQGENYGQAAR